MEPRTGGQSPVEAVGALLRRLKAERREPTDEELRAVEPLLRQLQARVRKVKALGAACREVDLSDEASVLAMLGGKRWSKSLLRRMAATFLY